LSGDYGKMGNWLFRKVYNSFSAVFTKKYWQGGWFAPKKSDTASSSSDSNTGSIDEKNNDNNNNNNISRMSSSTLDDNDIDINNNNNNISRTSSSTLNDNDIDINNNNKIIDNDDNNKTNNDNAANSIRGQIDALKGNLDDKYKRALNPDSLINKTMSTATLGTTGKRTWYNQAQYVAKEGYEYLNNKLNDNNSTLDDKDLALANALKALNVETKGTNNGDVMNTAVNALKQVGIELEEKTSSIVGVGKYWEKKTT